MAFSKRKKIFLIIALLIISITIYIIMTNLIPPLIINYLTEMAYSDFQIDLSMTNLRISLLFSYILIEDLSLYYNDGLILNADEIRIDLQYLIMLLFNEINIKQIFIKDLSFNYSPDLIQFIENLESDTESREDEKKGFKIYLSSLVIKNSSFHYADDDIEASIKNINFRLFSHLGLYYEALLLFDADIDMDSKIIGYNYDITMNISNDFQVIEIKEPDYYNIILNNSEFGRIFGEIDLREDRLSVQTLFPLPMNILNDISGTFFLKGVFKNRLSFPDFSGEIFSKNLIYNDRNYDSNLILEKTDGKIRIEKMNISSDPLHITASGLIDLEGFSSREYIGKLDFNIIDIDYDSIAYALFQRNSLFDQRISAIGTIDLAYKDDIIAPEIKGDITILREADAHSPVKGSLWASYSDNIISVNTEALNIYDSILSAFFSIDIKNNKINGNFQYQVSESRDQQSFIQDLLIGEILNEKDIDSFLEFWSINTIDEGHGSITGNIYGNLDNPKVSSRIKAKEIVYSGVYLGNINGYIKYFDETISLMDTIIEKDDYQSIMADGSIDLKDDAPKMIELEIIASDYDARTILNIYEIEIDIDAELTGLINIDSEYKDIRINFEDAEAKDLIFEGFYFGDIISTGFFKDDKLVLSDINLYSKQGKGYIHGYYDFNEDNFSFNIDVSDFAFFSEEYIRDITTLDNFLLDIEMYIDGEIENLNISADGIFHSIKKDGNMLPDMSFNISIKDNQGNFDISIDESMDIIGDITDLYKLSFNGNINNDNIILYANAFTSEDIMDITVPVNGTLNGNIDINDPDSLFLQIIIDNIMIDYMQKKYKNQKDIQIVYFNNQFIIKDFILKERQDIFRISGIIDPMIGFDLNFQSNIDLSLFGQFLPEDIIYTIRGSSDIYLDIYGPLSEPVFRGRANVDNGFLRLANIPYPISNIRSNIIFEGMNLNIRSLTARFSHGEINSHGDMLLSSEGIENLLLHINGQNIHYSEPKIFNTRFNSDLRFTGNHKAGFILSGNMKLDYFHYIEKMDITSKLTDMLRGIITGRTTYDPSHTPSDDLIRLDIKVTGDRNLSMDNDLGNVLFKADLDIRGSMDNPVILGRAEIIRGNLYLLNNTFTDLSGNLEFINPFRFDPIINFSGRTYINGYNINVSLSGTFEKPILDLNSSPALPEIDILSLLGTGKTTQELVSGDSHSRFGEYGISTILTSPVTSYLEQTAQDLFRFDRITISPILSGSQSDLSAKITIEKRLTDKLFILYSFTTAYGEEQVAILKYQLTNNINLILQRSEFGSLGGDIQFGVSFD